MLNVRKGVKTVVSTLIYLNVNLYYVFCKSRDSLTVIPFHCLWFNWVKTNSLQVKLVLVSDHLRTAEVITHTDWLEMSSGPKESRPTFLLNNGVCV